MLRTLIVLPDGTELFSGAGEINAIQSATITECVNGAQELTLGSCCANMVEAKILTPNGNLSIAAGDELTVYRVADDGARHSVGKFTTEKPTRTSANTLSLTAYDRVSWLDQDLTQWLAQLDAWPYSLYDLAAMTCDKCGGLRLANDEIPNGDYTVQKFSGDGITGRQLMQWIGQVSGQFCRATVAGDIEFAWYEPARVCDVGYVGPHDAIFYEDGQLGISSTRTVVKDDGAGNVELTSENITVTTDEQNNVVLQVDAGIETFMYYQNGLSFEDYAVAQIEKVQIRHSEDDIGTVYPDGIDGAVNTYIITGNPMLTASSGDALLQIAESLYERLKDVAYTPCRVSIPANMIIHAGHTLQIVDKNGKSIVAYVMSKTQSGQRDTIVCTGSPCRDSTTAVNNKQLETLNGKVLKLRTDVDGIFAENADGKGKLVRLQLDVEGLQAQAESTQGNLTRLTALEQTAESLRLSVQSIQTDGASKIKTAIGYTFDDQGLQISREGQQMKNLLDNTGMYVTRNGQTVLQANDTGVIAVDVKVKNFLIVGDHARFEKYGTNRMACYWLDGLEE